MFSYTICFSLKIRCSVSSLLGLILTVFVCICSQVAAIEEDDAFVKIYGNEFRTSGVWPAINKIRDDEKKLKYIAGQAYNKSRFSDYDLSVPFQVLTAVVSVKTLEFHEYKPIKIDVLTFTVDGRLTTGGGNYLYHITKGLVSECIFYLIKKDRHDEDTLLLHDYICHIEIPEPNGEEKKNTDKEVQKNAE